MSNNDAQALNNAGEIIERFGGIRPMAAKIDTPVTTVQGWKKRDVIPGTRRDQILSAAKENNIDISDLVKNGAIANQNAKAEKPAVTAKPVETEKRPSSVPVTSQPVQQESAKVENNRPSQRPAAPKEESHDDLMAAIAENNRKTMVASAWIATGLILLAVAVGTFLLWPNMQDNTQQIEAQSDKIDQLESEVNDVNERTSFIKNLVPENIQAKMDNLQTQAQNIQNTVQQLSEKADKISNGVFGADAGPLSQRLMILEEQMAELSGGQNNFGDLIARIKSLEESVPGQEQLKSSVDELRAMVENQDTQSSLNQNLADAQNDEDGALSQTLEGVSGNDLKAAAMLIAFSQLRDSLNRQEPFENDLALLEKLAGDDNPELKAALDRLAPHANGGVLTAEGLSGEFKGLAGDIVVSSLKGEDVSLKEKATARLSNIFQVEKEGELVAGTDTQVTVSKAQKMLDEGNIKGAIAELQTLDGEAAQTAQPFIQQAQVSLLAEKVQEMLGQDILSKISGQLPIKNMLQGTGMENIMPQSSQGAQPTM
ncbi:MAG TPA: mitofilin family membrane protein, partial [Alphaproteobacteria bacterium]|nr:mitofilin family membrane protein [Alphaproteobacteria bacterium]